MNKIDGRTKSISEILKDSKFSLDYYQREYSWEKKQVAELLDDLSNEFLAYYRPDHTRKQGKDYGHYFLGSIIIDDKGGERFVIDGQQRLTSLTLLLIYIYHELEEDDRHEIKTLIHSSPRGVSSFNLDVEERNEYMKALLEGKDPDTFDAEGKPKSIANIRDRYRDIVEHFTEGNLTSNALLHFSDWLIHNVDIIQITTSSVESAYTIFETMNDRGLNLTPTEMLKGYLLSRITDNTQREKADEVWRKQIISLQASGKGEDSGAIKAWLRSQYAQTQKGMGPRDFDKIGSEFHRWVRGKVGKKELDGFDPDKKDSFFDFITHDFRFYGKWYEFIHAVAKDFNLARKENVEAIHYIFRNNPALWYMVLLAPLNKSDLDEGDNTIRCKLQIVSSFLDILTARRLWNGKNIGSNTIRDSMINLIQEIRGKSISELITILTRELSEMEETFESNETLALHGRNKSHIHYLLARMTDYVGIHSGRVSLYSHYNTYGYQVEHIWADQYKEHGHDGEFGHERDFEEYRNRIGGLLLLPQSQNASYQDDPYDEKRKYYLEENLLAASLHEQAYEKAPRFNRFRRDSNLDFKPYSKFGKEQLNERQELYRELCKQIWNPENLKNM